MAKIDDLKGKTLAHIEVDDDNRKIDFHTADGGHFSMYHSQDCCESVIIDDVTGDWDDLIGTPITFAEESSNSDNPKTEKYGDREYTDESHTWTFYKLGTVKGWVDVRWYGSSNGYYSEGVNFKDMNDAKDYGW